MDNVPSFLNSLSLLVYKMPSVLVALVALLLLAIVRAESNVTIDDMDPRVMYQPPEAWSFQGNVRYSPFCMTANTHFYHSRSTRKIA